MQTEKVYRTTPLDLIRQAEAIISANFATPETEEGRRAIQAMNLLREAIDQMFKGLGGAINLLVILFLVSLPLALWKLVDILIWVIRHLNVSWS